MKKKGFIGLSTLLLVLLLGLFTTSYAKTLSVEELQNFIYNAYIFKNGENADTTNINNFLENNITSLESLTNTLNNNEGNYIMSCPNANTVNLFYYTGSEININTRGVYKQNNTNLTVDSSYLTGHRLAIDIRSGREAIGSWNSNSTIAVANSNGVAFFYTDTNIYTTSVIANGTIVYNAGYETPTGILDGPYESTPPFAFIEEPTTEHGNVYDFENVPVYTKPQQNDLLLGFLTIPNEITITNFRIDRYYYQGGDWQQKVLTYNQNNPYIIRNLYYTDQNQKAYNYYYKQENLYKDNIYYIRWGDTTTEPYQWAYCIFYIKSDGTTISGGMIHNPSGDPIQDIINNGNENDDFWKKVYADLFTLDSGDSKEILDNFITSTNLGEVGALSGELMILKALESEPTDFIISWNSIKTPNIYNSGQKVIIESGDINLSKLIIHYGNQYHAPTKRNEIIGIMDTVRIILGYTVIVLLLANLWETIMRALGVGVGMYEANEEEKARLEITEETEIYNDEANGQSYVIQTTNYPRSNLKYRKRQNTTKIPNKRRIGF